MIRETAAGVEIAVRVIPRARRSTIDGERDGHLLVRLSAPPVDNAANDALIAFLSEVLDVPKRSVQLVAGATSRSKRVAIQGMSVEGVRARLALFPGRDVR